MKPIRFSLFFAAGALALSACAFNRGKVKSGFDFSKVRRISVAPFEGPGGQAVTDEFVRELVGAGFEVTDMNHPGDVVLKGSVTDYKADNAVIVFLGKTSLLTSGGQTIDVTNPVVSLSPSQGTPESAVIGAPKGQVTSVSAAVGVAASLVDSSTGHTVWMGSYTYEAIDIQGALQSVIRFLTESFERLMPPMHKQAV